jgi:nicotinamide-nucleotide amidase
MEVHLHAEIVTTGTELLLGEITDTNSTYIARQLRDIGLNLYYITSAGDNQQRVARVLDTALDRSDIIITTGGLGPTVDDVTREAVAQATGRELVHDARLEASIEAFFQQRGYTMSDNNRRQARIPQGAIPLENPVGTAPCFIVEDPRGVIISLPGVPREMRYMMTHAVLPYLNDKFDLRQVIKIRTLKTCGIGESSLDARIGDLEEAANPTVGLAAHPGQSHIRITAKADSVAQADALIAAMEARVRERVGEVIFGVDDDTLESIVVALLNQVGLDLAVAEVNTDGLISSWLNRADPQGDAFRGGWVLSDRHPWTMGQDRTQARETRQEGLRLANQVRTVTGANVGLAVLNSGPGETYLVAVHGEQHMERRMPFRGHESHAQIWVASTALDLVRQMCLARIER